MSTLKEKTRQKRMWDRLLEANKNCAWRSEDGYCLLRSKNDKNGLWRRGKCSLPCAHIDLGMQIQEMYDNLDRKKKHR